MIMLYFQSEYDRGPMTTIHDKKETAKQSANKKTVKHQVPP